MRIDEIMSHPVVTVPTSCMLDAAARLMWEFDCGIVPVVGGNGCLAGVITDRDICMAAYTQDKPLSAIPIASVMTKHVFSLRGTDTVETAEHLMRDNQVRRVTVIDAEHRPIGIVAMNDIARLTAPGTKTEADRDLVKTLAAIGKPRQAA